MAMQELLLVVRGHTPKNHQSSWEQPAGAAGQSTQHPSTVQLHAGPGRSPLAVLAAQELQVSGATLQREPRLPAPSHNNPGFQLPELGTQHHCAGREHWGSEGAAHPASSWCEAQLQATQLGANCHSTPARSTSLSSLRATFTSSAWG